jgi:hypothetical protein
MAGTKDVVDPAYVTASKEGASGFRVGRHKDGDRKFYSLRVVAVPLIVVVPVVVAALGNGNDTVAVSTPTIKDPRVS